MMTRALTLLALLLTPFAPGCSEDGKPGGDTGEENGASTESMTGNNNATADAETDGSGGAEGSSGGVDLCGDCVATRCIDQTAACTADETCGCWIECIDVADDPSECVAQCGDMPSTLEDVFTCVAEMCADPCELGGGSTGGA